jgi:hypothetical protein
MSTTLSVDTLSFADLGNVPPAYVHEWRVAEPMDPIVLPGAVFKWYHVHRAGVAVPSELDAEAREVVAEAAGGVLDVEYGLNFALLHHSTTHAFLIIGIWRGHQELWERIYAKELGQPRPFTRIPTDGPVTPAACVWELGVICHEMMAWHRYLFSERAERDKHTWLADSYAGRV